MTRAVPVALASAISGGAHRPFAALEIRFDSAPLRLWTGLAARMIDGASYAPGGALLSFGSTTETADLSAQAARVSLSGVPSALVALALAEPFQRREARILYGDVAVTDVVEVFAGIVNVMPIKVGPDTATISVTLDSRLITLRRPRLRRYTQEMQEARYPGDTFLSYVASLALADIPFGRKG